MATDVLPRFAGQLQLLAADVPELRPIAQQLHRRAGVAEPAAEYRAIQRALAEITVMAGELADERVAAWLTADATVLLVMAAAAAVLEADGLPASRGADLEDPGRHRQRAVYWRNYGRGPVTELHRNCARDLSRGWLRLLSRPPRLADQRLELQRARFQLIRQGRQRCTDLRTELLAICATGSADFEVHARHRLAEEFAAAEAACGSRLGVLAGSPRWRRPVIPGPVSGLRRDEMWLGAVLGVGFGLGAALGASRLLAGLAALPESTGAVVGLVAGLALALWVIGLRVRLQRRAVLERWIGESVGAVRQAAEEELVCRFLEVQARTSRIGKLADWQIAPPVTGQ
ncbi:hypothetical protein [Mycobacterium sp. OTB74]|jgi:hypothetical protein|uniref:hypothetical protein n=1 Tax=Mycobacterium sp. OTB74 TaxID=1853452 RepID=UPI00247541D3|nr:hypothetical protein [Mycobacterium sp. OTB74]MDH6243420.1 hypothetical protein [Mycobacterium sp. OTB74]